MPIETPEKTIRKLLAIPHDVDITKKLPKSYVMQKYHMWGMHKDRETPKRRQIVDDFFAEQGLEPVSAQAPVQPGKEDAIRRKRSFDGSEYILVNADAFYKLVRLIVRGKADHLVGKKGIKFLLEDVVGSKDYKVAWDEIKHNRIPEKKNGKLSVQKEQEGSGEEDRPREQPEAEGDSKGELQSDAGEGAEGVGEGLAKESPKRGRIASIFSGSKTP
jgi:hypothetical protein